MRGVTDLAEELAMDKSRVHRILSTLHAGGWLSAIDWCDAQICSRSQPRWARGLASRSVLGREDCQLTLEELALRAQESVVLCVGDGLGYRTIASADGPSKLRFATELGRWFPGSAGATGHVIFANHPDPQIIDRLILADDSGTPGARERLAETHALVRKHHHAVSYGEFDPRVMAIAAPVHLDRRAVAGLAIVGAPSLMSPRIDQLADMVRSAAIDLERTLRQSAMLNNLDENVTQQARSEQTF